MLSVDVVGLMVGLFHAGFVSFVLTAVIVTLFYSLLSFLAFVQKLVFLTIFLGSRHMLYIVNGF